ncbi:MAG: TonB-dependent receptor, partial [Prolixibacteraceae bacterium]
GLLLVLLWCLIIPPVMAQKRTISGLVTEKSTNEPLPGVSVVEKGTIIGTVTNMEGRFSLSVNPGATLQFSFIGMKSQDIPVGSAVIVNVQMETVVSEVDEVVVVGYGTQKKANLTGAVASVDVDKALVSRPIQDISKGLQGITPGLTITYGSGAMDAAAAINIRGTGTIINDKAAGSPLVLVDGVPMSLSLINPEDIASISVLKDAASASIYGARAAFGVVLITTKSGASSEKISISYTNNFAFNTPTTLVEFTDPEIELPALINAKLRDGQAAEAFGMDFATLLPGIKTWKEKYADNRQSKEMIYGEDWGIINSRAYFYRIWDPNKEMLSNWTPQSNNNITASGKLGDKSSFIASFGYHTQEGIMKINPDELKRFNVNLGLTTQLTDWLKADFRNMSSRQTYEYPYNYYDATGFKRSNGYFGYYQRWGSFFPYGTYKGQYFRHAPGYLANANTSNLTTDYVRWGATFTADITKKLNLITEYSIGVTNERRKNIGGVIQLWDFWSPFDANNIDKSLSQLVTPGSQHDRVSYINSTDQTQVFNAYFNYNTTFREFHNVKAMAGVNLEWNEFERIYAERRGLMDREVGEVGLGTGSQWVWPGNTDMNPAHTEYAIAGYFVRINYDYKGKYLLELNGRMDGSSRFPSNDRWAFFPSGSLGYRITEENFMKSIKPVLNDLKIRASVGSIGNQEIRANAFLPTMPTASINWITNGVLTPSVDNPRVVDPGLSWERVTTYDAGFDARLLGNMFGITFDWYQRNTEGMLAPGKVLPEVFGADAPETNAGDLRTRGFELTLDFNYDINKNINIYAQATLADYKSVVTKWNNPSKLLGQFYEGMEIGEIWGLETERLYQESDFSGKDNAGRWILNSELPDPTAMIKGNFKIGPGDVKYADIDPNKIIDRGALTKDDHGDLKIIGNSDPHFQYGIRLGGTLYGFDIDMFFQGVGKRDYWSKSDLILPLYNRTDALYAHQLDFWTSENTDAFFPNPYAGHATNAISSAVPGSNNFVAQTRYLTDLSYLRFKNLTVGYTIPSVLSQKANIQKVRVYFSAQNLAEWTKQDLPVDPEINETEAQWGRTFPYTRTISFGLQVNF